MSYNLNQFTLTGIVGSEPKNVANAGQTKRVVFKLFSNRGEKSNEFFLTAWDKTAEFCESYIRKGDYISVIGYMESFQKDDTSPITYNFNVNTIDPSPYKKNNNKENQEEETTKK